jgi:predicted ATP-grasp superfamily ATP-dependent carboligase
VQAARIPAIVEPSIALINALRYTGISEIEYKIDSRDGRQVLIEINPRHWDQHALGIASGVNLTSALYADLCGEAVPEMHQSERAVSWIAEEGFLIGLQDVVRRTGYPWRQYLRPLFGTKTWATFAWDDPQPSLRMLKRVAAEYARSAAVFARRGLGRRDTSATVH